MICKNCGAHFDDNQPKCPYCGEFHYAGAEKEYMDRLKGMKEDLNDLNEAVPEVYSNEFKNQARHVKKIVLIIIGILAVLALLLFGSVFLMEKLFPSDPKAELLFQQEAYPIADDYYNAGDYEGLLEFYQTSITENVNASFYYWDHYSFLNCYENYTFFLESAAQLGTEDFSAFDMQELFYCYISNRYYQKGYPMDEKDQELVSSFEDEMETVLQGLELTADEEKDFNDLLNSSEYPSWDEIEDFSKKVYKRMY